MVFTKIAGTDDHYISDKPLVITGLITGTVTLPDGTVYDVTPGVIEVEDGHQLLVSDAIGARYVAEGNHPSHQPTPHDPNPAPFVHTPSSVTHNPDGTSSQAFADAVHAVAVPVDLAPSHPTSIMAVVQGASTADASAQEG